MPARHEIAFINQAFRDVADQDYIAARTLHRAGLDLQFLWAALQAMEKYIKGILLYNGLDTRRLGHHLVRAYDRVQSIADIPFDFPSDTRDFLEYLEMYGQNRYLQHPYFTGGEELRQLDRAVWYVRCYCQYLRTEFEDSPGKKISVLSTQIKRLQSPGIIRRPTRFRILGGHLEQVLGDKQSVLRKHLVWYNEFFGAPRRRHIRSFPMRSVSVNPIHFLDPDVFSVLCQRVDFPREVVDYFRTEQANSRMQPSAPTAGARRG